MKVLLGSGNPHKVQEITRILGHLPGLDWVLPGQVAVPRVPEEGRTVAENAVAKARLIARATGLATLAEDSALEVEALGGAPGVRSARFAGPAKDAGANNRELLARLQGQRDRRARFRTVAALALPDGRLWTFEGTLEGQIAPAPRGGGGFGYDPLFIPTGERRTLAELAPEEKDRISHRRRALEGLRRLLSELAAPPPATA
ncbi:MAG: RdgB/HAM1 family non-canonical purine NTP pyrophosphatase [Candidatus Bipolaricaulaceae bacterium]